MHKSFLFFTGGRVFGPSFGRQALLVSGNLLKNVQNVWKKLTEASQTQHDI